MDVKVDERIMTSLGLSIFLATLVTVLLVTMSCISMILGGKFLTDDISGVLIVVGHPPSAAALHDLGVIIIGGFVIAVCR